MSTIPTYPTDTLFIPAFASGASLGVGSGIPHNKEIQIRSSLLSPTSGEITSNRQFARHRLQPIMQYEVAEDEAMSVNLTNLGTGKSLDFSFSVEDVTGYFGHDEYTGTTRDFWMRISVDADGLNQKLALVNIQKPCPGIKYVFTATPYDFLNTESTTLPYYLSPRIQDFSDALRPANFPEDSGPNPDPDYTAFISAIDPEIAGNNNEAVVSCYVDTSTIRPADLQGMDIYGYLDSGVLLSDTNRTSADYTFYEPAFNNEPTITHSFSSHWNNDQGLFLILVPRDKWGPGYEVTGFNGNFIYMQYNPFQFNDCPPTNTYCINMFNCDPQDERFVSQCYVTKTITTGSTGQYTLIDEFDGDNHSAGRYMATWTNADGETWMDEINVTDSSTGDPEVSVIYSNFNLNDSYGITYSGTTGVALTEAALVQGNPGPYGAPRHVKLYANVSTGEGPAPVKFRAWRLLVP